MPHQFRHTLILLVAVCTAPAIAVDITINGEVTVVEKNEQRWWPSPNTERDYMLPPNLEVLPEDDFALIGGAKNSRYRMWVKPMLATRDFRMVKWEIRNDSEEILKNLMAVGFVDAGEQMQQPLLLGRIEQLEPRGTWGGNLALPDMGDIQVYWYAELNGQPALGFIQHLAAEKKTQAQKNPKRTSSAKAASAWSMVELYQQANKPDIAREQARKLLEQHPDSLEAELARKLLGETNSQEVESAGSEITPKSDSLDSPQIELTHELQAQLLELPVADLEYHSTPLDGSKDFVYYGSDEMIHRWQFTFEPKEEVAFNSTDMRESLSEAVRIAEVVRAYSGTLGRRVYELYLEDMRAEEVLAVNTKITALEESYRDAMATTRKSANAKANYPRIRQEFADKQDKLTEERERIERATFQELEQIVKSNAQKEKYYARLRAEQEVASRAIEKAQQENELHLQQIASTSDGAAEAFGNGLIKCKFVTGFHIDSMGAGSLDAEVMYQVDFSYLARNGQIITRRGFIGTARLGNRWTVVAFNAWGEQKQISDIGFQNVLSGRAKSF